MPRSGKGIESHLSQITESAASIMRSRTIDALGSLAGGAIDIARGMNNARIQTLLIIVFALNACNPMPAKPSSDGNDPVATEPVAITPEIIIDQNPAGFGLPLGPQVVATPSTDSSPAPVAQIFVAPTTKDLEAQMRGEAEIPEIIKDAVALRKAAMEKKLTRVAEICEVPVKDLKIVFKEGSVEDQYRWTLVYKGKSEAGEEYICWAGDPKTRELDKYPTVWDENTGKIETLKNRYFKVNGDMDFAGTTPVVLRETGSIIPGGQTAREANNPKNLTRYPDLPVEVLVSIDNPISSENMEALTLGGYVWDGEAGVLKSRDGGNVLSYQDGKWVDPTTEVTTELSALSQIEVKALDFQGREVGAVLIREVNGERQIYLPSSDAWVVPIDVASAQQTIDRPDLPAAERGNHRSVESVVLTNLPEISFDDFKSGRLFYSELTSLKPWPANVRKPDLQYARISYITNVWGIIDSVNNDPGQPYLKPFTGSEGRPSLLENDGIKNLGAYNMKDPLTGKNMVVKAQQYYVNGYTVILHMGFGDAFGDANDINSYLTKSSLNNPSERITFPLVNIRPNNQDWCGEGGLGGLLPQHSICALQGYEMDLARDMLPPKLQSMIAEFDIEGQLTSVPIESYPIGPEIYGLQQLLMPQNSQKRPLDYYLLPENKIQP